MHFYIAASLSEISLVRTASNLLQERGWIHTYDWTQHCSDMDINEETVKGIAEHEFDGIKNADIVIVLNPKGRGTHIELGMAFALNKKIYLYHWDDAHFTNLHDTVSFYWLPQANKLSGTMEKALERILDENREE